MTNESKSREPWAIIFPLVWGFAAILGSTNGYLSSQRDPSPPVVIQAPGTQQNAQQESARERFFYFTDRLVSIKDQLPSERFDQETKNEVISATKHLSSIAHQVPCDPVVAQRAAEVASMWEMSDALPDDADDSNKPFRDAFKDAVAKLVDALKAFCK